MFTLPLGVWAAEVQLLWSEERFMLFMSFSIDDARESSSLDFGLHPDDDSPSIPM